MKVLIIEDHPIVIAGFRASLSVEGDIEIVDARSGEDGLAAFSRENPDCVVIDINLPDRSGFDVSRQITDMDTSAKILIFTMSDAPILAAKAVEMGAKGFFSKNDDPSLMAKAIRTIARGEIWLPDDVAQKLALVSVGKGEMLDISERELDVLRLLAKGRSMSEIAEATAVSYKTVTNDCAALREKLNARTSMELVRIAVEQKII